MSELDKARKADLYQVAIEMDLDVQPTMKVVQLRQLIKSSPVYEENFVNELVRNQIAAREEENLKQKRQEELEEKRKANELELEKRKLEINFELEKLKLQAQTSNVSPEALGGEVARASHPESKIDVQKLLPTFKEDTDDVTLFLVLLERQLKLSKVPEYLWVSHLLSVVPSSVSTLIARESEENASNFAYVKDLLLKRFKISAGKFRQLLFAHRKLKESTWRDYCFELRAYFENWLKELNVNTFEGLQDLIIADLMKRRVPSECKEHLLDDWENLNSPLDLAEKLDAYDNIRSVHVKKDPAGTVGKKDLTQREFNKKPNKPYVPRVQNLPPTPSNLVKETTISCYGCGKQGFIKKKCPNCSPTVKKESVDARNLTFYSCNSSTASAPNIPITICNKKVLVCADTGANHSVAGERMYKLFQESGVSFQSHAHDVTLADGITQFRETLSATVPVNMEGRVFETEFIILPNAKGNRTLLGMDFLQKANLVIDAANQTWYFSDKPRKKYTFVKECDSSNSIPVAKVEVNPNALREDEGKGLTPEQRNQLNSLLQEYERCFQPGGEATPYAEHRINTGDSAPISVPPYRMTPAKKEILKKEIDNLIAQGIIEECESPYASPVVLVPKPDGSMRLCIDYRKLNSVTVPDTYPLPRMDDLLHEAKHTSFMSTLDLRSGYHQINIHPPDRDKTAFVCPFGTFRYLKMPFGLRNAPATFQRLMDRFRSGLKDVLALSYLDDIIILSSTFEDHISDLKKVFERLIEYKLNAKREKCHFACDKVKYLGHWITPKGLEVDPAKVEAIVNIPPPKTVKQVQSFLQTCSWYRRFIPKFADISKPLSNLIKKKTAWKWGQTEQEAFETLKKCLTTSPVLKQADGTKPFILKTDASNYALGAVLLQGDDITTEHPIEYASRLLTDAERNYSTTEREALAVVWALEKFRGYVEGQEINVATDHQPLKWLLNLKSPSGRLARWALQIQSYNLKIDYVPGKSNVVADMLSRPITDVGFNSSEMCNFVGIDFPTKSPSSIREAQLSDENLKKIIDCFENDPKDENFVNWTDRGYFMNQGILYRYAPDSDTEEAQLVIPSQERENILKFHHDSPTAGHYGEEGTYQRIAQRYYWTGMRSYISEYVKKCPECCRFKANNQKPAGLLRTPAYAQRFETLSIDLFGPLPESKSGHKWIFIVEDCATRWVELFPLVSATAPECATTLIEEVFFRYGIPRKLISDNGPQFVSAVLQQVCCTLDIDQSPTPLYHPQANPVERKNRDLKPRLAILVGDAHDTWAEKLPSIRFALNSAKSDTTGYSAAFLQFGRELRTIDDVVYDLKAVLDNDNFVPEITPYLKRLANISKIVKERVEMKQDQRKVYYDKNRKKFYFAPGDKVWVTLHSHSSASKKKTLKFMPRRDGPYIILTQRSPISYDIASMDKPTESIGNYHVSLLKPFRETETTPVAPIRKRGRPKKSNTNAVPSPGRTVGNRGGGYNKRKIAPA